MKTLLAVLFCLLTAVASGYAQVAQPGSITVTQQVVSNAVSAGSSATAVLAAVSGQFGCVQAVQVTLDVPTSGTTPTSATVTIVDGSSGGWTVSAKLVDTTSAGAYYAWPPGGTSGGVLQTVQTNKAVTVTVGAVTNGGAGYVTITGYTNTGGC